MQPPPLSANPYSTPQASVRDPAMDYGSDFQYAGFWLRFAAQIIDSIVSSVILFVIALVAGVVMMGLVMANSGGSSAEDIRMYGNIRGVVLALFIPFPWIYYASCEASNWQATPGKKALGLRVTDLEGAPIGFARASGRFWGKLISYVTLCIGFMVAGWTEKKQGLHDMMAGTLVIRG